MELFISKKYLAYLFFLWIAPVVSAIWGYPIWITVSFMAFFAIYAGHEWAHVWVCQINRLEVISVNLMAGGETHILYHGDSEDPELSRKESDVSLAGVAWDSLLYGISISASFFFAAVTGEFIPVIFGTSLILVLIFNLAMPGSDWREYYKRASLRA